MIKAFLVTLLFFVTIFLSSCNLLESEETVSSTGKISKLEASAWMYGSHILNDNEGKIIYALKSSKINLTNYENKNVIVFGKKVEGYPVDSGPDYIEVTSIQEAK